MSQENLKTCPFCGINKLDSPFRDSSHIARHPNKTGCPITGQYIDIRDWNNRSTPALRPLDEKSVQKWFKDWIPMVNAELYAAGFCGEFGTTSPSDREKSLEEALTKIIDHACCYECGKIAHEALTQGVKNGE